MERIKSEAEFGMIDWWKKVFIENYANFEGRARRSEYWYYVLANFLISIGLWIVAILAALILGVAGGILMYILIIGWGVANIIPSLAAQVRRLHDTNKTGWMILLGFIPVIGGIILLVFYFTEGDSGDNQYGPDPKAPNHSTINEIGSN
ncbi:DUF805 domain-containing protein [Pseudotenacibaculum haliotis]|uniref:DUF805 domain-containing protein n=1 Tax=Pseudotenacibaculum haliotis TaxID=1862138 RepID=A0ABW5LQD9_9FLAO